MSDEIKLIITVDSATAKKLLGQFGDDAKVMGDKAAKSSEAGRLGFFALGNAVEDAARSMGVAGQASRQMGNSIERLAASALPAMGTAIGMVVLVGMSAVAMITQYIEKQEKLREETMKAAAAADEWVRKNEAMTRGLQRADYNAYLGERKRKFDELAKGYAELIDKEKKLTAASSEYITLRHIGEDDETRQVKRSPEKIAAAKAELEIVREQLRTKKEELTLLKQSPQSIDERTGAGKSLNAEGFAAVRIMADREMAEQRTQQQLEVEASRLDALDSLWATENANYEGRLDMQLAAFDAHNTAKLNAMSAAGASGDQIAEAFAISEIQRAQRVAAVELDITRQKAAEKKMIEQASWQYGEQIAVGITSLMIQHGKKGAEEQKKAARMAAIVHTAVAVTKVLPNWYLAALVAAAGAVQIATINSASYGSSGGGGMTMGGAPVTGEDGGYRYFGYEQSQYGTGWRPGQGQGQGNTTVIIQAMDSKSFEQYVNENPNAVLNVVEQREKGYV